MCLNINLILPLTIYNNNLKFLLYELFLIIILITIILQLNCGFLLILLYSVTSV